jgi:glucose-1-phosphate thymidylyltransferase
MKAVVLARGKGTRMRKADDRVALDAAQSVVADAGLKAMIPFRRPFLDYVLSALADAGCDDIGLVIGPEHGVVRDYYQREQPPSRVRVSFLVQAEARGTADAVLTAESFAAGDPFLVLNSDNYYPIDVLRKLVEAEGHALPAFRRSTLIAESNIDPERVRSFAVVTIDERGDLQDIIEKPDPATFARFEANADDIRVSMNCWRFMPSIFTACRLVEPSARGELELPNAVRYARRTLGERFTAIPVDAGVLDLSRREDIAEVERRLAHIDPRP